MFLEKGTFTGKKNRIIVGFDLGEEVSQISFRSLEDGEPRTVSAVTGEEQYDIPTVLCRRWEGNQWAFGREAMRLSEAGEGILVEHLLSRAKTGEELTVGEETFDAVALLALFIRRSLSLLGLSSVPEQIESLMVTVEELDRDTARVLSEAVDAIQLQTEHIYFQNHVESFYYYALNQPKDLWMGRVLVCDDNGERLKTYLLECNRRTTPIVAFVEEEEHPQAKHDDDLLHGILEERCREKAVTCAYLIGRGFEEEWYSNSLKYLCRGRRVFRGNNLYSKGACYGAEENRMPGEIGRQYVFLGKEKLKANLGMRVLRQGEDSYFALLSGGMNWFDADRNWEFYLENGNSFSIIVTPLTGRESKEVEVILHELPERGERATRIGMSLSMESEKDVLLTLEDLGFGEIDPATHKIWQERFSV